MSGRFEYFTATLLRGVSNLIQRPNPFRDEYRPTQASRQLARWRVKWLLGKGPASNLQLFFASLL